MYIHFFKSQSITKWKKPIWDDYILHDSNNITFRETQSYRDNKKISSFRKGVRDEEAEHRGFLWHDTDGHV